MRRLQLPLMLAVLAGLAIAWELRPRESQGSRPSAVGYAKAGWRLAPQELDRVLLTVDHLLIRHDAAEYHLGPYTAMPAQHTKRPARSRQEALDLARRVRAQAHADPSTFAELARARSEDRVTAPWGGALGTLRASQLPPAALDALAVLEPGEVSEVIETALGFHVLRRRETPRGDERVSGKQLVISHKGVDRDRLRPGRDASRSRAQAHTLAQQLVARLKVDPDSLDALIERHTDHPSALRGGDFGEHRLHAGGDMARETAVLSSLDVGGVSQPVEGDDGFRILVRTPLRARVHYVWDPLLIPYDPSEPGSLAEAGAVAQTIMAEATQDPAAFDRFRDQYGNEVPSEVVEGRGVPLFEHALSTTDFGEMAAPLDYLGALHILRRLDPETVGRPAADTALKPWAFALSEPEVPDVDFLLANAEPDVVATALVAVAGEVGQATGLDAASDERVASVLQGLAERSSAADSVETRAEAVAAAWSDIQSVLGQARYARFRTYLEAWATNFLMRRW